MDEVYKRIRELRRKYDYTLKDVSDKTGLSVSFLSQVERGATTLAITSLKKIADAFDIPITDFFEDNSNQNFVVKAGEQKTFQMSGYTAADYARLAGNFSGRMLEPIYVTLEPESAQSDGYSHPGEEFYYVLEGTVIFTVDGTEYLLQAGDSIHFPSTLAHTMANPLKQKSVFLCVLTPVIF